jgi:hypothetical protein
MNAAAYQQQKTTQQLDALFAPARQARPQA